VEFECNTTDTGASLTLLEGDSAMNDGRLNQAFYTRVLTEASKPMQKALRTSHKIEKILQHHFKGSLPTEPYKWESEVSGKTVDMETPPFFMREKGPGFRLSSIIDFVSPTKPQPRYGVELKAIELPAKRYPDPFYYLSQIASDYARLSIAKGLDGGQLAVLLFGDIFNSFPTKRMALLRHFHKEMYWAYRNAIYEGGDLHPNLTDPVARYRRRACCEMGFNMPSPDFFDETDENFDGRFATKIVDQRFMFVVFPIKKGACKLRSARIPSRMSAPSREEALAVPPAVK
jgi:hypothetical protein